MSVFLHVNGFDTKSPALSFVNTHLCFIKPAEAVFQLLQHVRVLSWTGDAISIDKLGNELSPKSLSLSCQHEALCFPSSCPTLQQLFFFFFYSNMDILHGISMFEDNFSIFFKSIFVFTNGCFTILFMNLV